MHAYQRFFLTVAAGTPGILAVALLVPPPPGVPALALAVNPTILLILAAVVGPFAAQRMHLRSAILMGDPCDKASLIVAFGSGLAIGGLLTGLDCATAPIWRGALPAPQSLCQNNTLEGLVLGLLYGGVTEELIMRWGLLSIVAVGLSRFIPKRWSLAISVALTATLFALAHLPAVWLSTPETTTATIVRTLALNGVAGVAFGLAYIRVGLEGAILAHVGFHVATFAISLTLAVA